MDISFLDVLLTVFSLVILALPGFILAKCKMLPQKAADMLSVIVLYVCQCALVFTSFQSTYNPNILSNMLIVFGLAVAAHLAITGIIVLCTLKSGKNSRIRCMRYSTIFSNCGFMGIPFLQSIFQNNANLGEILIYGAVVIAVFNLLNWTLGVYIITGEKSKVSLKKIVFNPVIISIILGFLVFVILKKPIVDVAPQDSFGDKLLTKIMSSVDFFSHMVTPLSMTVIGIKLASITPKELFCDKYAYITSLFKLVVMSLVVMLITVFLPVSQEIKYVMFFLLSMPTATSSALFAVRFGGDVTSATSTVLLSTVLSVLTVPVMYSLFGVFV